MCFGDLGNVYLSTQLKDFEETAENEQVHSRVFEQDRMCLESVCDKK